MRVSPLALLLVAALLTHRVTAQCGTSFSETFTAFANTGNWVFDGVFNASMAQGGNPEARIYSSLHVQASPSLKTTQPAVFGGDYRLAQVSSLGIDLQVEVGPASAGNRQLVLRLVTDNGTATPSDDTFVDFFRGRLPAEGGPWVSYMARVESDSLTLPPGWRADPSSTLGPDGTWNAVIQQVTQVRWFLGDPLQGYSPAEWRYSADNARIAWQDGPSTYCSAQPNSAGCSPSLEWEGRPSLMPGTFFTLRARQLLAQQPALIFYGFESTVLPLGGGLRCVGAPLGRIGPVVSISVPPPAHCSGQVVVSLSAFIQSGVDPDLVAGQTVYLQLWSRDPHAASGSSLTNALRFVICP